MHEWYTRGGGRLTMAQLRGICRDWHHRDVWACGPAGLLEQAERHWRRTGLRDRLHVERFRPDVTSGGRVTFTVSGRHADADGATPLLAADTRQCAAPPLRPEVPPASRRSISI
ncbi:hypothetical protein [Dactylosporangium sp. NPDC051484]|uniref:hypothetical protein n=1 Tax=Dactylosporangium sp. NPDC051484 TaxID=3154942 RepID=UPI00344F3C8A